MLPRVLPGGWGGGCRWVECPLSLEPEQPDLRGLITDQQGPEQPAPGRGIEARSGEGRGDCEGMTSASACAWVPAEGLCSKRRRMTLRDVETEAPPSGRAVRAAGAAPFLCLFGWLSWNTPAWGCYRENRSVLLPVLKAVGP